MCGQSCPTLWPHGLEPTRLLSLWDFPGKNTGMGCRFLLQRIFPTQGSNSSSSALVGRFFTMESPGKPLTWTAAHQTSLSFTISQSLLNSYLLSWWCHPTIWSSVLPFSSFLQSFPASGSFPVSQLFVSGGQSIGASPSTSVIPVNIQGWFPLGLTGLISVLSKGLSRVFSSTTVHKHQFFCIGTWNVRSMNQGKLEMVKQEMARVNTDILGISEPKWTGMGEFNSNDHYIYYCGQESLRRNGEAIIITKKSKMQYLDAI